MRPDRPVPATRPLSPLPGLATLLALGAGGALAAWALTPRREPGRRPPPTGRPALARRFSTRPEGPATHRAARRLNRASTLLGMSVLADSGVEHYRGSFHNPGMVAPLVSSALVLAASAHGIRERDPRWSAARHAVQIQAAATGVAGLGFHAYNVGKHEGGYGWLNLFYAAPIGAPFALTLAGAAGAMAERVRGADPHDARVLGLPAGPLLAAGTAMGLLGTVGEAGLLHFRGAFHNPAMLLPVTVPPLAAAMLAGAAIRGRGAMPAARAALWATAAMGMAGVAFHAYGVSRNMGGWRNWSQNLLVGPPIPAPPSFAGLALAGLAALDLMEARDD